VPSFQLGTVSKCVLALNSSMEAAGRYQLQYNSDLGSSNSTNLANSFS
jgi:hypothetical protein